MADLAASAQPAALHGRPAAAGARAEQAPVLAPDEQGFIERDGVRVAWRRYGKGTTTVLLLPTWSIIHSRFWKPQLPYLARHNRVLTFDGRGNGSSDRPQGTLAYTVDEFAADAVAVMDASGTHDAVLVALSCGALWATTLAAEHPRRVRGIAYIGPAVALAPSHPEREVHPFDEPPGTDEGWAKYNSHYWRTNYGDFLEFFFAKCLNEPHSTKQIEDCIGWALETSPETLADTTRGIGFRGPAPFYERCARVRCPTLVIHGDRDLVRPHAQGLALAEATGGTMVTIEGAGHMPAARDPVRVNLLLRDFIDACGDGPATTHAADVRAAPGFAPPREIRWTRAQARRRRALYISSPIGLGHAGRDAAIAQELRRLRPDLEIDWLAQHPVTAVLHARGERIHPASAALVSESAHFQRESRGHELNAFEALRRMDEILLANFMVFSDVVREQHYDLWIGDEAWELDYFLHENPELKAAPYVWLSDFVGYLPLPEGGEREAALTADYNTEMLEQIDRFPRVRDRSIFIGEPADILDVSFGPGLPQIRDWTEAHFDFSGYITGFDPAALPLREELRASLGYRPEEQVCVVAVGGSGVGADLLELLAASFPAARELVPSLRMILVAGPRIDPARLPPTDGLEVRPYVPDLYLHLAACDLAIVQGGLATCMELAATRRPFLYFPLRRHFEQRTHVRHRLERHRAGRCMEFDEATPAVIAQAIADELERGLDADCLPVDPGAAARTASLIGELL